MSEPPAMRLRGVIVALLVANVAGAGVAVALDDPGTARPPTEHDLSAPDDGQQRAPEVEEGDASPGAVSAAAGFLDRYLAPDGRIVRRDQGGDTVSEGQAYGLLAAVGAGDRTRFDLIWTWTAHNLRRPDGLLSWRWSDGAVVDPQPAADADLDAAWALALAARRWPDGTYGPEARALTAAIVEHETVAVAGRTHLAAGPWAVADVARDGSLVVNPSYPSPVAVAVLVEAGFLDPGVGGALVQSHRAVIDALVADHGAPSDWARVDDHGVRSVASPVDARVGGFGWDAVRVPLRLAGSCDPLDGRQAAAVWPAMEAGTGVEKMGDHPGRLVGAAAAVAAAGEAERAWALLREARTRSDGSPTYYGDALVALGHLQLTTDLLGGCPPL